MSKKTVWHSGPPPSVGWWPASVARDRYAIRWWDGRFWSRVCRKATPYTDVDRRASKKAAERQEYILWTDRPASWPARSKT